MNENADFHYILNCIIDEIEKLKLTIKELEERVRKNE